MTAWGWIKDPRIGGQAAAKVVEDAIATDLLATPMPLLTARLLLMKHLGQYQGQAWAAGRTGAGDGKTPNVWGAVCSLSEASLAVELAKTLTTGLRYSGLPIDKVAASITKARATDGD